MADISTEIEAFRSAERGEQVRSSMISAIYKPFNVQTAEIKSYDVYRTSTIE